MEKHTIVPIGHARSMIETRAPDYSKLGAGALEGGPATLERSERVQPAAHEPGAAPVPRPANDEPASAK